MKNSIYCTKKTLFILITALIVTFIFTGCFVSRTIKIKTEYGDHFTVSCDSLGELYVLRDDNSYFYADLDYFSDKDQWNCQEMCSQRIPKILDRQESGGVVSQPC